MSDTSAVLSFPFILPSQAQKHVTHNEAIEMLDILVQTAVLARGAGAPPANPAPGDRHIVGAAASGAWAGQAHAIAVYGGASQGWRFHAPLVGWRAYVVAAGAEVVWTGTEWVDLARTDPGFDTLGISATADATNRLTVSAPATLLTHAGGGHQLKINKAASGDTASLLFQDNWSGRAEMGLAGDDNFAIKVSANGAAFTTALSFAAGSGLASGAAVQTAAADATPGRLLRVGAFGIGAAPPEAGNIGATDNARAPGFYGYDGANGSSGGPAGVTTGIVLHQRRAAGAETQVFIAGDSGIVFSRARSGGAWGVWRSGGAETGSNAQGRYRRDADGTMTCWQTVTTLTTGEAVVTFPAAFVSAESLVTTIGVNSATSGIVCPRFTARSATGLSVSAFGSTNARLAATVEIVTTGRWA